MSALGQKQHLVSLVAAKKNGAAVTFTLVSAGAAYDPSAGTWSGGSTSTVTGTAERVQGDPKRYEALNLVESESPTLKFTPDTYGQEPPLLSAVTFGGSAFIVRDVAPWAPDGTTISSRVIVSS